MTYKTINVSPNTYDQLVLYKHAGMTFDAVLNEMMKIVPEGEFYGHILQKHRKRMKKIKAGDFIESNDLDEALKQCWGDRLDDTSETNYRVIYGGPFLKDLKKIIKGGDKKITDRVKETVEELKKDPHRNRPKVDLKLISSRVEAVYRVRLGKYRMVYEIDEDNNIVILTMIFPRGRGYWRGLSDSDKQFYSHEEINFGQF